MRPSHAYAATLADRLATTAQLAAAGISYRTLAAALRTTPQGARDQARAGAYVLQRTDTAPPELRAALRSLPPLPSPTTPARRRRPQLPDIPVTVIDPADLLMTSADLTACIAP
ncbi:hypothetical protein ABZX90_08440 [Streptomyces sp. NPDC002935]|uniref:hypothetical protein n=1 Tax=Streptomyces sp. NPDC002935 TaxID=3154545 RepID=UPI0033BA4C00